MDDKSVENEVMRDYTKDVKGYFEVAKIIIISLCIIVALLVAGLVVLELHHQDTMMETAKHYVDSTVELFSEYDWKVEYEIETTDNEYWSGNVIIGQ